MSAENTAFPTGIRSAKRIFGDFSTTSGEATSEGMGMLWTIAVILLVLWLIGWLGFHLLGGFIHILVIIAVIVIIVQLVRGT